MALAIAAPRGRADHHPAPAHALLGAILEASAAEVGWLAWLDRPDPLVLGASSPIDSTDIRISGPSRAAARHRCRDRAWALGTLVPGAWHPVVCHRCGARRGAGRRHDGAGELE